MIQTAEALGVTLALMGVWALLLVLLAVYIVAITRPSARVKVAIR